MPTDKDQKPPDKKRGPKPEVLKIDEDPGVALDKLLGKRPPEAEEQDEEEPEE